MTDLLTPEKVKVMLDLTEKVWPGGKVQRLCRDYLTLWDQRNDLRYRLLEHGERIAELEAVIPKRLIQQVGGTETR